MATIYEIVVRRNLDETVWEVMSQFDLIDASEGADQWKTMHQSRYVIGAGYGNWNRQSSTQSVILLNGMTDAIDATLFYETWPLAQATVGTISLSRPFPGTSKNVYIYEYMVWSVTS